MKLDIGTKVKIPKTANVAPCLFEATGYISDVKEDAVNKQTLYVVQIEKPVAPGEYAGRLRTVGVPADCLQVVR